MTTRVSGEESTQGLTQAEAADVAHPSVTPAQALVQRKIRARAVGKTESTGGGPTVAAAPASGAGAEQEEEEEGGEEEVVAGKENALQGATKYKGGKKKKRKHPPVDGGGAGAEAPKITSETVAKGPGSRSRTTIGIGEEVNLTRSDGAGHGDWYAGAGEISAMSQAASAVFTAPDTAGSVTVKAGAATLTFHVIAPVTVHMERVEGSMKHHIHKPDSGFQAIPFLLPDQVSFYNVRYVELDAPVMATGTYAPLNGTSHGPGQKAVNMSSDVQGGKGTRALAQDTIYSGIPGGRPPFKAGHGIVAIPIQYWVGSGAYHLMGSPSMQVHTIDANGKKLRSSKGGASCEINVESDTINTFK